MLAALVLLVGLSVARPLLGADTEAGRFAPSYASSSVVNAASQESGIFAPNTIITLYGRDLAYVTRAIVGGDVRDGVLPTVLSGTGVRVYIDNVPAPIYFVSPSQVNLLVPANVGPGLHQLHLSLDGRAGTPVDIRVGAASPALFLQRIGVAIAVRLDGSLVSTAARARPGDTVILFATGLGTPTGPPLRWGEVARSAAALAALDQFDVLLNGRPLPRDHIYYAGLSPGFAGLYQINVRLPLDTPADPFLQISASGSESPGAIILPVRVE